MVVFAALAFAGCSRGSDRTAIKAAVAQPEVIVPKASQRNDAASITVPVDFSKALQLLDSPSTTEVGVEYLRAAAARGNANEQLFLGIHLLPSNKDEALKWIKASAAQDNFTAQTVLGNAYIVGDVTPKELGEGMRLLRRAAEQGSIIASNALGQQYQMALEISIAEQRTKEADLERRKQLLESEKTRLDIMSDSANRIANAYDEWSTAKTQIAESLRLAEDGVDKDGEARVTLRNLSNRDPVRFAKEMKNALNGQPNSIGAFMVIVPEVGALPIIPGIVSGAGSRAVVKSIIVKRISRIEQGYAATSAQRLSSDRELAAERAAYEGMRSQYEAEKAKLASDSDELTAASNVSRIEAIKWHALAACRQDVFDDSFNPLAASPKLPEDTRAEANRSALYRLLSTNAAATPTRRPQPKAIRFFVKAAREAVVNSRRNLAVVEANAGRFQDAAIWFELAAQEGDTASQLQLADMYYRGRGVLQDFSLALMWVNISCTMGNDSAQMARTVWNQEGHLFYPKAQAEEIMAWIAARKID